MPLVFSAPPISLSTAHAFAAFFMFSYIGSLYVSKNARLSFKNGVPLNVRDGEERAKQADERWRNDPDVIRARLLAATMSTVGNVLAVYWLVGSVIPEDEKSKRSLVAIESTLSRLGITLNFAQNNRLYIILPCLIAPILYLGPLYCSFLWKVLPFQQRWSFTRNFLPILTSWIGLRNYVLGPITEEVVFRACVLAVYHMAGVSRKNMIFFSPLAFGVAHLHHAWDTYNRYGRTASALRIAALQTLSQLLYTSLFGFHCAFLFLRTGSLLPPTISHIFCNIMGLPQYGLHVRLFPTRRRAIQIAYLLGIAGDRTARAVLSTESWTEAWRCRSAGDPGFYELQGPRWKRTSHPVARYLSGRWRLRVASIARDERWAMCR